MNLKYKPGQTVWVGDIHYAFKCEVVCYMPGQRRYKVKATASGGIYLVTHKDIFRSY